MIRLGNLPLFSMTFPLAIVWYTGSRHDGMVAANGHVCASDGVTDYEYYNSTTIYCASMQAHRWVDGEIDKEDREEKAFLMILCHSPWVDHA